MAERSNAAVLKTVDLQGSGGSNPSFSAKQDNQVMMKIIQKGMVALLTAMLTIALCGCEKGAEELILGSWSASSISENVTGHPNESLNTSTTTTYGTDVTLVYTFNDDMTGTAEQTVVASDYSFTTRFTYTIDNDSISFSWQNGSDEGRTLRYKISALDKKELSFSRTLTTEGTAGDELGNLVPYTATTTKLYIFKRK